MSPSVAQNITGIFNRLLPVPEESKKPPKTTPKAVLTNEIVVNRITDRYSIYSGLDPGKLISIYNSAESGYVLPQYDAYATMEERDTHIGASLNTRYRALSGLDFEIIAASEEAEDIKTAEFVRQQIADYDDFKNTLDHLNTGIGYGFAISEIIWKLNGFGNNVIDEIKTVRQQKFTFMHSYKPWYKPNQFSIESFPLFENKFIQHIPYTRNGLINKSGINRTLLFLYMMKGFSHTSWSIFMEVYGMPLRLGVLPEGYTDEDRDVLKEAVQQLGSDASAVIPNEADIKFIERKAGITNPYEAYQNYADRKIDQIILGHDAAMSSTPGKLGGETNAEMIRSDLLISDAMLMEKTIQRDLFKPLVLFNFGPDKKTPKLKFNTSKKPDQLKEAQKDKLVVVDMSLPVSKEAMYEKYGLVPPKDADDILQVKSGGNGFGSSTPEFSEISKKKFNLNEILMKE
jgi:phage gp29-like protein